MICPACGSKRVHRSHRHWYERPLALIRMRPYRCHDCNHRFFSNPTRPAQFPSREPQRSEAKSQPHATESRSE